MARRQALNVVLAIFLAVALPVSTMAGDGNGKGNGKGKGKTKPTSPTSSTSTMESISTVVDQGGFPNAVGADAFGRPCVAYFEYGMLKFAVLNGSTWDISLVGPVGGDFGPATMDMAVDSFGRPTVVFLVTYEGGINRSRIKVASFDGTTWNVETIDANSGSPSIAVGPGGEKYVAYTQSVSGGLALRLAENHGSGWTRTTVDNSNVSGGTHIVYAPSVAVDSLGNVGISYGDLISTVRKQVRYAYRTGGSWQISVLHYDVGVVTQLRFDSSDQPHVAFWARTDGLRMTARDGSGWSRSTLPWTGSGSATSLSLVLDPLNVAHLTAYDNGSHDLHLYSGTAGNFQHQMAVSTGFVGRSHSMHFNRAVNKKCLTYSDQSNNQLKFMAF